MTDGKKQTALCPDGVERPYAVVDGDAVVVTPGGSQVKGTVTDGKFLPYARHYGAHLMWDPRNQSPVGEAVRTGR
jgi:hypothetical protein